MAPVKKPESQIHRRRLAAVVTDGEDTRIRALMRAHGVGVRHLLLLGADALSASSNGHQTAVKCTAPEPEATERLP